MSGDRAGETESGDAATRMIIAELADLRSRLEVPAWRNPANAIAALAFALSLVTSGLSIYSSNVKDAHDLQNELATVTEKLAALPLNEDDFLARHPKANYYDTFQGETSMFALEGYHLALKLGRDAATSELLQLASAFAKLNNVRRQIVVLRLALANSDNWLDELAARNALEDALLQMPPAGSLSAEAAGIYEDGRTIGARYPELGNDPGQLAYQLSYFEAMWGQFQTRTDCPAARHHLQNALDAFHKAGNAVPQTGTQWIEDDLKRCSPK